MLYNHTGNRPVDAGSYRWIWNDQSNNDPLLNKLSAFSREKINQAKRFHESFTNYAPTPLTTLPLLAEELGLGGIYVKDESYRFGLNAFKVLGGAYAVGKYIAQRLGIDIHELSFERLQSSEIREQLGQVTFITATDGNHGRGVAWAAQQLQQKAVVYMPKGSSSIRLHNITSTGAEGYITDWNYDECVRHCAKLAKERDWVVIQDTAWDGYEQIPQWIMQGYGTIALEMMEQLPEHGIGRPTHMFLQAGVGSFAGSMQAIYAAAYEEDGPVTIIVEPDKADCIFRSAEVGDGSMRHVTGEMNTIMAGLACGEPNPSAWDILHRYSKMFVSCPDEAAALGMRILGSPLTGDTAVVSGESGAVTTGLLYQLMKNPDLREAKEQLGLNQQSHVLLISTEGDTDPDHYRQVVWQGKHRIN